MENQPLAWWAKLVLWGLGFIVALYNAVKVIKKVYEYIKNSDKRHDAEQAERDEINARGEKIMKSLQYRSAVEKFILKHLKVAWYYTDVNGMTLDCSKLALDIMECEKEQVINNNWMNYIVAEDIERVRDAYNWSIANRGDFDCRFKTYTGKGKIINIHSVCTFAGDGYFGELKDVAKN